jgi:zinc-ribbon family
VLIIFGIRRKRHRLGVVLVQCRHCQRPCAHVVTKVTPWFTLFFIPVVPLGHKYFTVCSMCAGTTRIDQAEADSLVATAARQAARPVELTPDGPLSPPRWPAPQDTSISSPDPSRPYPPFS